MDTVRITAAMSAWEWALVAKALDNYALENEDSLDCSALLEYIECIARETDLPIY